MISYRFRRRTFLTGLSGGIGLKIMLRTLESSAQGQRSPGRLLVTHWPVGIVAGAGEALWKPTSGSVGGSPALKPFADQGLGPDMTVIRGLSTTAITGAGGGGHEQGTVEIVTAAAPGGTRAGEQESDDSFSSGPSIDQLLLQNVPALQRPGQGYANSIADSRTDFGEISTKCLSYSTQTQSVNAAIGAGPEAVPLRPILSPLEQYTNLFGTFAPGTGGTGGSGAGGTGGTSPAVADAMLKNLVARRSVLDFSIEELNQLKRLAPSGAKSKLGIHADAVAAAEAAVTNAINTRYPSPSGTGGTTGTGGSGAAGAGGATGGSTGICSVKPQAPPPVVGAGDKTNGVGNSFGNPMATQDDAPVHAQAGQAHLEVLKAAFICDLIRVGTYQWSPGTNHVGFALHPSNTLSWLHHPTSHRIGTADTVSARTLDALPADAVFLFNVHSWYFSRHAENFASWKNSVDGYGNNLLDFTCVPFLTEVMANGHERSNMPGMIIGGKQLGFVHNQYVSGSFPINAFWGTVAQAFGYTSTAAPFAAPIPGVWTKS